MKRFASFVAVLLAFLGITRAANTSTKPNIVFLLAEYLGWSDIRVHPGGSIPTLNME